VLLFKIYFVAAACKERSLVVKMLKKWRKTTTLTSVWGAQT